VTRIIAGTIGSLRLKGAASATRPTSDRVKESIFSKLDSLGLIEDANVLDLFAGTGSLGLEAASRGAAEVIFVEKDRPAFELLRANISAVSKALSLQNQKPELRSKNQDAFRAVRSLNLGFFDLVFLDPPYEFSNQTLEKLIAEIAPSLRSNALLIIERSSKTLQPIVPENFELLDTKRYGDSVAYFLGETSL
jgi:16S rRNA (guanine966-N2)-methyltransferase